MALESIVEKRNGLVGLLAVTRCLEVTLGIHFVLVFETGQEAVDFVTRFEPALGPQQAGVGVQRGCVQRIPLQQL